MDFSKYLPYAREHEREKINAVTKAGSINGACAALGIDPVSYTHLTLPTIYSV